MVTGLPGTSLPVVTQGREGAAHLGARSRCLLFGASEDKQYSTLGIDYRRGGNAHIGIDKGTVSLVRGNRSDSLCGFGKVDLPLRGAILCCVERMDTILLRSENHVAVSPTENLPPGKIERFAYTSPSTLSAKSLPKLRGFTFPGVSLVSFRYAPVRALLY